MDIKMRYGSGAGNSSLRAVHIDRLWENPDPTVSFPPQSIDVDLTGYRFFSVVLQFATDTDDNPPMQFFEVDETRKELVINGTSTNRVGGRHVTYDSAAGTLTFDTGYYNGAAANGNAIPLRIYGISI